LTLTFVWFYGCSPVILSVGLVADNNQEIQNTSSPLRDAGYFELAEIDLLNGSTPVLSDASQILSHAITAGRVYDFEVLGGAAPVTSLECLSDDPTLLYWTEASRLHLDAGIRNAATTFTLDCVTDQGSLSLALSVSPSSISVLSSNLFTFIDTPLWMPGIRSISPDGRYSVVTGLVQNSSSRQVFVFDHQTQGMQLDPACEFSGRNSGKPGEWHQRGPPYFA